MLTIDSLRNIRKYKGNGIDTFGQSLSVNNATINTNTFEPSFTKILDRIDYKKYLYTITRDYSNPRRNNFNPTNVQRVDKFYFREILLRRVLQSN